MSTAPSKHLFVYYRVRRQDRARAVAAVRTMQQAVRARWPGLVARLWRKPGTQAGCVTLMEGYALVAPGSGRLGAQLLRDLDRHSQTLAPLLAGPRHVEWFTPLP